MPKRKVEHPIAAPALRWRPDLVNGIPVFLDILDFAADTPSARFHEKPPRPIKNQLLYSTQLLTNINFDGFYYFRFMVINIINIVN